MFAGDAPTEFGGLVEVSGFGMALLLALGALCGFSIAVLAGFDRQQRALLAFLGAIAGLILFGIAVHLGSSQ